MAEDGYAAVVSAKEFSLGIISDNLAEYFHGRRPPDVLHDLAVHCTSIAQAFVTEIDPDDFGAGDACDCLAYLALAARFLEELKAHGDRAYSERYRELATAWREFMKVAESKGLTPIEPPVA